MNDAPVLSSQPSQDELRQEFTGRIMSNLDGGKDAEIASLKARLEQAERDVYVLESDARVQAKLLADTGRRVEELEGALRRCLSDLIALKPRADTGSARVKQINDAADRLVAALSPKPAVEPSK